MPGSLCRVKGVWGELQVFPWTLLRTAALLELPLLPQDTWRLGSSRA